MDPLGLYVHVPFCRRRCGYCSFSISTHRERTAQYLAALAREIDSGACGLGHERRGVDTVYLGGGTPSLLSNDELAGILDRLGHRFSIAPDAEITLEANPEDLSRGRAAALYALGVNRLSIGVQSLDDDELLALDRLHGADRALAALEDAVAVGGLRVSADLIVGLPEQSRESFLSGLECVLGTGVGHVSVYVLETDQPSRVAREVREGDAPVLDDDALADTVLEAVARIERAGLRRYEVSSFARAGEESRHNRRYWRRLPYLGFGPAAASLLDGERWTNEPSLPAWLRRMTNEGSAVREREPLLAVDVARERVFLGLRETRGLDVAELGTLAAELESLGTLLEDGENLGDLVRRDGRLGFSDRGFLRMNRYLADLF